VVLIIESTSGMYVCEERGLGAFADVKDHTWSVEIGLFAVEGVGG